MGKPSNGDPIDSFLAGKAFLPREKTNQSILGGCRVPPPAPPSHPGSALPPASPHLVAQALTPPLPCSPCSAHTSHDPQILRTVVSKPSSELLSTY